RRFHNPLYLSVPEVPGAGTVPDQVEAAQAAGRVLNGHRSIDRDTAWRLKLTALEAIWRNCAAGSDPEFTRWRGSQGNALERFATFCTLAERFGGGWSGWPGQFADPS